MKIIRAVGIALMAIPGVSGLLYISFDTSLIFGFATASVLIGYGLLMWTAS